MLFLRFGVLSFVVRWFERLLLLCWLCVVMLVGWYFAFVAVIVCFCLFDLFSCLLF